MPSPGEPIAVCVDPELVWRVWRSVAPLVQRAMGRGGGTPFNFVEESVLAGRMLVWLAWDGAEVMAVAVTELSSVHDVKVCTIVACAGKQDSRHWLHLIGKIEDFARAEQCECIRIIGRKGWRRVLTEYHEPYIVMEKRLAQ